MYDRDIAFDWVGTMGATASAIPTPVKDYIDMLCELVQDDPAYLYRTAGRHTCAVDDPIVILHHARVSGLATTLADHKLYDEAVRFVRDNRQAFFCDEQVERRMQAADGHCPMCGCMPSFTGLDHNNRRSMITRCQHITNYTVEGDTEAFLRRASVWEGKTWPYAWMQGRKLTSSERMVHGSNTPCQGCLELEAIEAQENALAALIDRTRGTDFARPGWGSPVSSFCNSLCGHAHNCDKVYMRVKRCIAEAQETFSTSKEIRLNDAGLKLYIKPVRGGMRVREVNFGMRVGGDQVTDYPGFQEFAHAIFAECGVPTNT